MGAEVEPVTFAYLDDIIVISATEEQHFANLAEVFRRDLQPEPQAEGHPLLLPVLIPPRDDRGEAVRQSS